MCVQAKELAGSNSMAQPSVPPTMARRTRSASAPTRGGRDTGTIAHVSTSGFQTHASTAADRLGHLVDKGHATVPSQIEEGVVRRHLEERAFCRCTKLVSVELPDTLKTISSLAFAGCTSLKTIVLPPGLQFIGPRAFIGCTMLEAIELPPGLLRIAPHAFDRCTALKSITLPDSVEEIEAGVFSNCSSLVSVALPARLDAIRDSAFAGCVSLSDIQLPAGLRSIGCSAFRRCTSLTSSFSRLPSTLRYIGDGAFGLSGFNTIVPPDMNGSIRELRPLVQPQKSDPRSKTPARKVTRRRSANVGALTSTQPQRPSTPFHELRTALRRLGSEHHTQPTNLLLPHAYRGLF